MVNHMLWYKGWLETRFRVLFSFALMSFILVSAYLNSASSHLREFLMAAGSVTTVLPVMLAGAGIVTQPALQASKDLHGSMYFTLSMPVTRFRLLAVRAALGWLEMALAMGAWCCALWLLFPGLRSTATAADMFEYAGVLTVCDSAFFAVTLLLSTFLDDLWRAWGSGIAFGALWWLFTKTPLPASMNIFRAMGNGSPLFTHTLPWTTLAFSLGFAAILFIVSSRVVQVREY
jgi:hypothetical protein